MDFIFSTLNDALMWYGIHKCYHMSFLFCFFNSNTVGWTIQHSFYEEIRGYVMLMRKTPGFTSIFLYMVHEPFFLLHSNGKDIFKQLVKPLLSSSWLQPHGFSCLKHSQKCPDIKNVLVYLIVCFFVWWSKQKVQIKNSFHISADPLTFAKTKKP